MLAIPLMNAKYERIFSSAKYLITDSCNRLKANIIKANKCLKSWFGRPETKAFAKGVDPDVDEQYKEEDHDVGDEDSDEDSDEDLDEDSGEDLDKEDPEGEAVKYTVLDD